MIAPITNKLPKNLADERSTFPLTVTTRITPIMDSISESIIFLVTFNLKNMVSPISVKMGRAATIIEALEAVVYWSPEFSKTKYITIPKKLAATIFPMSFRAILNGVLV